MVVEELLDTLGNELFGAPVDRLAADDLNFFLSLLRCRFRCWFVLLKEEIQQPLAYSLHHKCPYYSCYLYFLSYTSYTSST